MFPHSGAGCLPPPPRSRLLPLLTFLLAAFLLTPPSQLWAQNQPPVANAGPDQSMYTGDCITLNGSAYDPDGQPIVEWSWFVDIAPADSVWDLSHANLPSAVFCAQTSGQYLISLLVVDPSAYSIPDIITIIVADNLPPVAIATADKIEGPAPLTVQFDGSQSYDPEGKAIAEYYWDFGDGTVGVFGAVPPPHTFVVPGAQNTVTLTVSDERSAAGVDVLIITVNPPANTLPVASPTATPDSGDAPLTVQFTANATDADNDPLTCLWDFGDGNTSSEANPSHLYTLAGTYLVSLTVSDSKDPVGYSLTIVVNPDIGFSVTSATVKWQKAPLGDVALEGFFRMRERRRRHRATPSTSGWTGCNSSPNRSRRSSTTRGKATMSSTRMVCW